MYTWRQFPTYHTSRDVPRLPNDDTTACSEPVRRESRRSAVWSAAADTSGHLAVRPSHRRRLTTNERITTCAACGRTFTYMYTRTPRVCSPLCRSKWTAGYRYSPQTQRPLRLVSPQECVLNRIDATCVVCNEPFRWNGTRLPRVCPNPACLEQWFAQRALQPALR
jgi:hypothetical protein